MAADIENANLFMMYPALNESAATNLPHRYCFRCIRPDELDAWKRMPERANNKISFANAPEQFLRTVS